MVITIFDALGIQNYLFSSNWLAENIGASYLVKQALESWPVKAAGELKNASTNVELLYSAGGNAVFLVQGIDIEKAKSFAQAYSKMLSEQAPGLQVACHHHVIASESFHLGKELEQAFNALAEAKSIRIPDLSLRGMGVTQLCASGTEEPAAFFDDKRKEFLGPCAWAKRQNNTEAKEDLRGHFEKFIPKGCGFPTELDDLGRSRGEKSFIGVVHLDGNGVGKKLKEILLKSQKSNHSNEKLLADIKGFSSKVSKAGSQAMQDVMAQVARNWDEKTGKFAKTFEFKNKKGELKLPIRPLVYGGDDVTFVCDGRIALDLAVTYLRSFHKQSGYHACGGVALVKSHYPFYRAYALAEELCQNAKRFVRDSTPPEGSALDWQFVFGGPLRSISELRKEYRGQHHTTCRPYRVLPARERDLRDWSTFRDHILEPLQNGEIWVDAHSRLKGLTEYLQQGPEATLPILKEWGTKGFKLPQHFSEQSEDGFFSIASEQQGRRGTPYLDALELLDFMALLD